MKLLTINVWTGLDYNGLFKMGEYESPGKRKLRFRSLVAQVRELSPDVIFIQEANPVGKYARDLALALNMDEIHQVVNGGIKVGSLGIPANLKEGLVILARSELSVRKVDTWKLSGSTGIHSDYITFHLDEAVLALVGKVTAGGQEIFLVNVHLVAAPQIPEDLTDLKEAVLARNELDEAAYNEALVKWRQRQQRRFEEIKILIENLKRLSPDTPCIVGGDFNAEPDSMEMNLFKDQGVFMDGLIDDEAGLNQDAANFTWDVELNENTVVSAKATDARGRVRKGFDYLAALAGCRSRRLDYMFLGKSFSKADITEGRIVLNKHMDDVLASDHFGVLLEVVLSEQENLF